MVQSKQDEAKHIVPSLSAKKEKELFFPTRMQSQGPMLV